MADITDGVGLYREDVLTIANQLTRDIGARSTKDALLLVRIAASLQLAVANYSDSHEVLRLDLIEVKI